MPDPTPVSYRPADQSRAVLRLLEDAESYLSALHGAVGRHDHIGADLKCGGCALHARLVPALAVARQLLGTTTAEGDRHCVCGDPIEWMAHPDGPGWIHSPGSDTRCLDARPAAAPPAPADRAATLRDAADELGRMDYDVDANDYGYDSYRDAWNSGVMDGAGLLRRLAGEAAAGMQQTTEGEAELTATLVINRTDSYCDGCREPTLPRNTHHTDISGWTPEPGGGCGARFTATRSDYRSITADDLKDVRPDLPVATPPAAPAAPEERP